VEVPLGGTRGQNGGGTDEQKDQKALQASASRYLDLLDVRATRAFVAADGPDRIGTEKNRAGLHGGLPNHRVPPPRGARCGGSDSNAAIIPRAGFAARHETDARKSRTTARAASSGESAEVLIVWWRPPR